VNRELSSRDQIGNARATNSTVCQLQTLDLNVVRSKSATPMCTSDRGERQPGVVALGVPIADASGQTSCPEVWLGSPHGTAAKPTMSGDSAKAG